MTTLSVRPVDDPDQLALIADDMTVIGKPFADAFRDACLADAVAHDGWVHPSRVSAILRRHYGDFDPRRFSASWGPACRPEGGYLDKTKREEPIDPAVSKGNGNKDVRLRRWRGWGE